MSARFAADNAVLRTLQELLPQDRFVALLSATYEDAVARADTIRFNAVKGEWAMLRKQAHDLISSAGNIGARRAQSLAGRLQRACDGGDVFEATRLACVLAAAIEDTCSSLADAYPIRRAR